MVSLFESHSALGTRLYILVFLCGSKITVGQSTVQTEFLPTCFRIGSKVIIREGRIKRHLIAVVTVVSFFCIRIMFCEEFCEPIFL